MGGQGARRAPRIILTRRSQAMIQLDTGSLIRALVRNTSRYQIPFLLKIAPWRRNLSWFDCDECLKLDFQ